MKKILLSWMVLIMMLCTLCACDTTNGQAPSDGEGTASGVASATPDAPVSVAPSDLPGVPSSTPSNVPTGTPVSDPTASPTQRPALGSVATLYQLDDSHYDWQMMSYVIQTKENKLIVIDGGYTHNGDDLVKFLKTLDGVGNVPVIDAWFFTHCHEDHTDAFSALMAEATPRIQVKHVYYNFPSKSFMQSYEPKVLEKVYPNFMAGIGKLNQNQVHVVKVGDVITVGSVSVEVLLTPDEKITQNPINESSVVYRMEIAGQSILFLGDLGPNSRARLVDGCDKNKLLSDVVQMAHHGNHGLPTSAYRKIKPKVCLWPTPNYLWKDDAVKGYDTMTLYNFMVNTLKVNQHLVAKDGVQSLAFPFEV